MGLYLRVHQIQQKSLHPCRRLSKALSRVHPPWLLAGKSRSIRKKYQKGKSLIHKIDDTSSAHFPAASHPADPATRQPTCTSTCARPPLPAACDAACVVAMCRKKRNNQRQNNISCIDRATTRRGRSAWAHTHRQVTQKWEGIARQNAF